jgi:alkanesulfonate monooxygenase SsuD/methylene tetrahydromethanopterin reductase-like flavin-dependent oxidoreductase (luciferase family)
MTAPLTFGVFYDFRNPEPWQEPWDERYNALLDQIAWLEEEVPAFTQVSLSEHHFVDDGYSPSVLAIACAVAARTERLGILTNIIQLPLHHPLRIAEDALTADAISRGRLRLGVAIGYRELEFEALGADRRRRRQLIEEGVAVLRQAFAGEPFRHAGEEWTLPEVRVTPGPIRPGGPPIWMGGTVPAAIERAARLGDGFVASTNAEVVDYLAACERLGTPPERRHTCRTAWMVIDPDPERALAELGPHMLHQVNRYIDFGFLKMAPYEDPARLVEDGFYVFADRDGAIREFAEAAAAGVQELHFFAALPGERVETATRRLRYIAEDVIPAYSGILR